MDRLAADPAKPPAMLGLRLVWLASILVIVLALAGAYVWRSEVVASWPASERAYALFGVHLTK
jgi:hypothetical protein